MNPEMYEITIIQRDGMGQTRDDYHATIKRLSDGVELVSISNYRWLLKWRTRHAAVVRSFKTYDKHQKKLSRVEKIVR
jgi:hypothetical protein